MAKAISLNAKSTWPDVQNDYTLWYEGHPIGRIRLDEGRWRWEITVPMAMPAWAAGTAKSLDESKQYFANAWGRVFNQTSTERLERAWDLERAAEARLRRIDATGDKDGQAVRAQN